MPAAPRSFVPGRRGTIPMSYQNDQAITLRRYDYSETSQVLVLFGRTHGQIRLIARGIKRGTRNRFAAGIDLLELGEIVFSRREGAAARLGTLVEWRQTTVFPALRRDARRLYAAQYLAEITPRLTEEDDPFPDVFDAITVALHAIGAAAEPLVRVVSYQFALLRAIGLLPAFGHCVVCSRSYASGDGWHFSSHQGGLLCRNCEIARIEKCLVGPRTINLLRHIHSAYDGSASAEKTTSDENDQSAVYRAAFGLLDYHIAHIAGGANRLADLVVPAAQRRTVC